VEKASCREKIVTLRQAGVEEYKSNYYFSLDIYYPAAVYQIISLRRAFGGWDTLLMSVDGAMIFRPRPIVSPTENSWMLHPLNKVFHGYFAPDRTIPSLNIDWIERSDTRLPTAARFSAAKRWSSITTHLTRVRFRPRCVNYYIGLKNRCRGRIPVVKTKKVDDCNEADSKDDAAHSNQEGRITPENKFKFFLNNIFASSAQL
jgi:hypothetical protein